MQISPRIYKNKKKAGFIHDCHIPFLYFPSLVKSKAQWKKQDTPIPTASGSTSGGRTRQEENNREGKVKPTSCLKRNKDSERDADKIMGQDRWMDSGRCVVTESMPLTTCSAQLGALSLFWLENSWSLARPVGVFSLPDSPSWFLILWFPISPLRPGAVGATRFHISSASGGKFGVRVSAR